MKYIKLWLGIVIVIISILAFTWKPFGEPVKWIWFVIEFIGVGLFIWGVLDSNKEPKETNVLDDIEDRGSMTTPNETSNTKEKSKSKNNK